ncbi:hypothetical protein NEOLI_004438 [Neolecta irregularis DAH-3]|uniref:Uncharacterized protein n=1 Tax=Neolecta irregularis (strain DAH-3) TaxID=1198029 RepID=A0A1U7LLS3_NEOID|nr:hypothetical protein NEOLI_004438 [Neolecta irregularis DAH-3]|eukprot:OLL23597.1 hypothetical protein NEOLI_004438 [Neolecta irregularis DAH-3]
MPVISLHEHITGNYSLVTAIFAPLALTIIIYCLVKRFLINPSLIPTQALASWLILAIYFVSSLFLISAIIIQGGLGYYNFMTCEAAMASCITLYAASKFLLALFLVEKAHIVRGGVQSRWKDWMFKSNLCVTSGYVGILVFLTLRRWTAFNKDTGVCKLGFHIGFESSLITYDVLVNFYLTAQFFMPFINIWRINGRQGSNPRLRTVARRTIIGNIVANIGTISNLVVLATYSPEPSGICLACCSADVTVTAIALHWMSNLSSEYDQPTVTTSQNRDAAHLIHGADTFNATQSRSKKKPHWDDDDFQISFDRPSRMSEKKSEKSSAKTWGDSDKIEIDPTSIEEKV